MPQLQRVDGGHAECVEGGGHGDGPGANAQGVQEHTGGHCVPRLPQGECAQCLVAGRQQYVYVYVYVYATRSDKGQQVGREITRWLERASPMGPVINVLFHCSIVGHRLERASPMGPVINVLFYCGASVLSSSYCTQPISTYRE